MKIVAYLLEYPIDLPGGAQMSTESLCHGILKDSEYKPVVICPELLNKKETDYPFDIITYKMGNSRIQNLAIRILAFKKIINKLKPNIVHVQMPESLITYGLAFPGGNKNSKLIFTDRGMFYGYRKHSLILMKFALKKAKVMLTTTELNKSLWEENTNIRPIKKVANTISEIFAKFIPEKKEHEGFVLGFAGRICEEKNWPLVNTICKKCAEAGIPIIADVVVSTFEEGDEFVVKNLVDGLIADLGADKVRLHQDFTQSEMAEYYYGIDVFVMTSRFESFGKAAVEAMSRKCAVVSTDVGGLKEVIGNTDDLYTEDTVDKCIDRIRQLYESKTLLKAEQEYFYNRYKENFSQEKCLIDHLAIYREID